MSKTFQELDRETDSIHFYDKTNNKVILIHSHCIKDPSHPAGHIPVNTTAVEAQMIIDQIVPGGAYEFILDKLTDKAIDNLGYVLDKKREYRNSFLHVEEVDGQMVLAPKYYLDLSLNSADKATLLDEGEDRKRQIWSFDSDGETPLEFKIECRRPQNTECKRNEQTSQKLNDKKHSIKVEVTHGKLIPKNGIYDLKNGECTVQWILPDETIEDAKIWARDLTKDFEKSDFRTSNTLTIRCY